MRARDLEPGELHLLVAHPASTSAPAKANGGAGWLSDLRRVEARVWTEWKPTYAQRGTWMDREGAPGAFTLAGLPPGRYQIEVGSSALGWTLVGPVQVGPGETVDLGLVRLPPVGSVRVERSGPATRDFWLVRRERVELLLESVPASGTHELLLAPGEYLLFDPSNRPNGIAFTLAAGEAVVVGVAGVLRRESLR